MPKTYFWTGTQVIVDARQIIVELAFPTYERMLCMDDYETDAQRRYGYFTNFPKSKEFAGWNHVPFDQFPKDFKLHLLIMT